MVNTECSFYLWDKHLRANKFHTLWWSLCWEIAACFACAL